MSATLRRQLSVRLTDDQRSYVREQAEELRGEPALAHVKWAEADVVRALIEEARRTGQRVLPKIMGAS